MIKRWMVLVIAGMLFTQVVGCGNKNQESTEVIEEPAGHDITADSDTIQSDIEKLPPLNEAENETASSENVEETVYEPAEISCIIPKGFEENDEEAGLYLHKNYPKDVSSISYVISESEEDVTQLTSEEYKVMLEDDFYNAYGDNVPVSITRYDKIKVDGRPGLEIKLEYEFKGVMYEQLIYMIYNGTESHILSYTQEKDGKWMDEFEKSGESIALVPIAS